MSSPLTSSPASLFCRSSYSNLLRGSHTAKSPLYLQPFPLRPCHYTLIATLSQKVFLQHGQLYFFRAAGSISPHSVNISWISHFQLSYVLGNLTSPFPPPPAITLSSPASPPLSHSHSLGRWHLSGRSHPPPNPIVSDSTAPGKVCLSWSTRFSLSHFCNSFHRGGISAHIHSSFPELWNLCKSTC